MQRRFLFESQYLGLKIYNKLTQIHNHNKEKKLDLKYIPHSNSALIVDLSTV
jgi:hypothetical protein